MAEPALRIASNEARLLREMMECLQDSVTVVGTDGCVLLQNAASIAAQPNPAPRSFADWDRDLTLHSSDGARRLTIDEWPIWLALKGRAVPEFEASVLRPANPTEPVMLRISARPIHGEDGQVIGAVLISRDVTDQRRLERELAQVQRLEAIGQLSSGIAHDFNNILTAINAYAGALTHNGDAERQAMIAQRIESACAQGGDLVGRLLAFARKQPLSLRPVEVNPLVEETVALLRPTLPRSIDIRCDLSAGIQPILADASQLSNALLNLAVNARDAMPEGGRLQFRTEPEAERILIEVSDTGIGIPFDQQAKVFEPFFTSKDTGTGLGLAMVYGFVAQLGGALDLKSAPGIGTAVSMRLPRAA